jgi:hypothetical protein
MKISTFFVSLTIVIAVSLFILFCSNAKDGTIIYSEDFSSDPNWITNNSANFYWDQLGGRYHYKIIDNTSEYAYHPLNLMDRGFQVIFDICPTITTLCGDNRVGVSDSNMSYISPTSITVYMSNINSDHFIAVAVNDNLGRTGGNGDFGNFTDGVIYRVTINYDRLTNDIYVKVTEKESGDSVCAATVTGYGPFSGMDRIFMASIGDWACPGSYGEGYIDNVIVTVTENANIPTLTEWGLIIFGVVLLGFMSWVFLKRRKAVASYQ